MSRTRRFLGGLSLAYVNQAAVMLTGLWLARFYIAHLGVSNYGLWLAGTQLVSYLMLMDLGIVALLPREVAYSVGREGGATQEIATIVGESARVVLWQTPAVGVLALLLWLTVPAQWAPLRMPLLAIMAVFTATFPLRVFVATLEGLQDLAFLGSVQFAAWAANVLTSVALIASGWGLGSLAVGWLALQAITVTSAYFRLKLRYGFALPSLLPKLTFAQVRTFFRRGFWLSVAQVAQSLVGGTDLLIVTYVLGPEVTVVYALTGKLVSVLANQPQLVMNAASPAISELRASGNYPRLVVVSICLTRVMMIGSGLVACVILAVNQRFVGWWMGPDKYGGLALTCFLLAVMLVRHLNHTLVASLICYGRERSISLTTLADGFVTVVAAFAGIHLIGIIGAPLGSLIGASLIAVPRNLTHLAHEMHVSIGLLLGPLVPWLWRFAIVAAVAQSLSQTSLLRTLPGMFAVAAAVGIGYCALLLPLLLRDPLGEYTRPILARFRLATAGVR